MTYDSIVHTDRYHLRARGAFFVPHVESVTKKANKSSAVPILTDQLAVIVGQLGWAR
jgi:hypothetical protein